MYKPVKPTEAVNPRWSAENRHCRRISFITRQRPGYRDPTVFYTRTRSPICSKIVHFPLRPYRTPRHVRILLSECALPVDSSKMQCFSSTTIRGFHDLSDFWKFVATTLHCNCFYLFAMNVNASKAAYSVDRKKIIALKTNRYEWIP